MKSKVNSKLTIAAFTIISFFALSSFLNSPDEKKQYATLRVFESFSGPGSQDAKMSIAYEDGRTEEIEMEKFKLSNLTGNTKKINDIINNISNKGYELINSTSGPGGTINYTFVKR